jgi:hypothetical protein
MEVQRRGEGEGGGETCRKAVGFSWFATGRSVGETRWAFRETRREARAFEWIGEKAWRERETLSVLARLHPSLMSKYDS